MWNAKSHQIAQYLRANVVREFPGLTMKPKTGIQAWALLNDKMLKRLVFLCLPFYLIDSCLTDNSMTILCSLCNPSSPSDWGAWEKALRKTFNIRGGNYADVMNPTLEAFALVVCNWYFRAIYQLNMVM